MTNAIAIFLGVIFLAAASLDLFYQTGGLLFLARKVAHLIAWIAVWQ